MKCLFNHNYTIIERRRMKRISLLDPYGTVVPAVIMICTKCGDRKVQEA